MLASSPSAGARSTDASLHPAVAAGTVFVASGAVLMLEILAVRLLAPYVGLTMETTTSIIGAALAGIAVGAALGGWLSDRREPRRLLVALVILGGLLALITVPVVRALGPGASGKGDAAALGITLLALVPVAAVLSAVSPTVARLQLRDLSASGTTVGRLSAWATAGALLGTFGTGFVLVPLMPVSQAVFAIGAVLVVLGLVLGFHVGVLRPGHAAAATAGVIVLGALTLGLNSPCDAESSYHCARIEADAANPNGRFLYLDDLGHSYVDLKNPRNLVFPYVNWMAQAIDATAPSRTAPRDAVFIGGGGFTLPRWLLATRPGSHAHVMEVDGKLVDLDREQLGLRTSDALQVTVGDARMTLRQAQSDSADIVVGDAFGSLAVPWHLATKEWSQEIRRVLRPGGLYALNVIDARPLSLLKAEAATLMEVFSDVRLVTYVGDDGRPGGGNAVLLASDRPLPEQSRFTPTTGDASDFNMSALKRFAGGAEVLRDDHAPVDQLLTTS